MCPPSLAIRNKVKVRDLSDGDIFFITKDKLDAPQDFSLSLIDGD